MTEGGFKFKPQKSGLAAALEQAKNTEGLIKTSSSKALEQEVKYSNPVDCTDRIRIIFDDSGSMSGAKIADAIEGTIEFMRNCVLNQTAVAIHPMNEIAKPELETLTANLPALSVAVKSIPATDSTPLFRTIDRALDMDTKATRFVIFSDGQPSDKQQKEETIARAIEAKIPCDTVLISNGSAYYEELAESLMKEIAERTGGIYLKFDRTKVNFKTAFKYLAPTLRLQLSDGSMRKALEEGRLK